MLERHEVSVLRQRGRAWPWARIKIVPDSCETDGTVLPAATVEYGAAG